MPPPSTNPPPPPHMTGVCLTVQGSLTTAILSDIIPTLQMVEMLIVWEGILTVKANASLGILIDKPFRYQNSLGQPAHPHPPTGFTLTQVLLKPLMRAHGW